MSLDRAKETAIMKAEKGAATSGQPCMFQFISKRLRNRHLAEWRFLLFTIIVTVKSLIWNVIRIVSPPLGDVTNRLPFVQRPMFTVPYLSTNCNIRFICSVTAASAAMPPPQAVCRQSPVTRASRSKARLIPVTIRRDSWRIHVHRTRFRRLRSSSSHRLPM